MRSKVRSAFTLVEILIVVIILGILAAIVVPQFTSASEDAQISNTETQLSTIRNQIELFRVRNNAQYPDFLGALAGGWGDPAGATPAAQALRGGDYLRSEPINPRTRTLAGTTAPGAAVGGTLVIAGVAPAAGDVGGWMWDATAGEEEMYACRFDEVNREWLD
ncbi:MAG: prepilin-type N-terminal cleavage/methylation domain-containing protein [Phycisphaerales bacterium JB039]